MADISQDWLLLGGGIRHITATQAEVKKFLLAYVILFQRVNFRQYFVCLRERIFNCCKVLMLSWSWSSRSNSGGYLRDYRPQWTPFFSPYPVVTQSASSTGAVMYVILTLVVNYRHQLHTISLSVINLERESFTTDISGNCWYHRISTQTTVPVHVCVY